ncbi:MAG: pyridoxal-phosphate dependent enzyme, partial [Burkholderiales bacterium]|nr:pyridoxal-phosphate dependent enzyme [Burkholderiales bacterium]
MLEQEYLTRILKADVYDVARETPLHKATLLSQRLKNTIFLKREDLQDVFSFKLRGAYNKMAKLTPEERERGVIAASAGNHAQGVALAASKLGCRAVIVMPITAPTLKVNTVRRLGGEVVLHGDSFSDAASYAEELRRKEGLTPVPPFDDPEVIAGQGTIAMEIIRQAQKQGGKMDAVFVPIGGGGLASGIAVYIKALYPEIKVFGVQTVDSDGMRQSIEKGCIVELNDVGLFSD